MKICKFCQENEANKKNTHYLTDSVIRLCLNHAGSNGREEGLYVTLDSDSSFIEPSFQRNTSHEALIEAFGRETTEKENEVARENPYSVDYYFCKKCEDAFSAIENGFQPTIERLRELKAIKCDCLFHLSEKEKENAYKWGILQIWRTAVCTDNPPFKPEVLEEMRRFLRDETSLENISNLSLRIEYLQTRLTEEEEQSLIEKGCSSFEIEKERRANYTHNVVSVFPLGRPLIIMNDLILKLEEVDNIPKESWGKVSNIVVHPDRFRRELIQLIHCYLVQKYKNKWWTIYASECARRRITARMHDFIVLFCRIVEGEFIIDKYSESTIRKVVSDYLNSIS